MVRLKEPWDDYMEYDEDKMEMVLRKDCPKDIKKMYEEYEKSLVTKDGSVIRD